jgi:hypothetical protein
MSIVLGGQELNPNLFWSDKAAWSPVIHTVRRTVAGRAVVSYGNISNIRPITLVALQDQGWVDKVQYDFLQTIAQVDGAIYQLEIGVDIFRVMFRHQDSPALELSPLITRSVPLDGDYFIGSIKLMAL